MSSDMLSVFDPARSHQRHTRRSRERVIQGSLQPLLIGDDNRCLVETVDLDHIKRKLKITRLVVHFV